MAVFPTSVLIGTGHRPRISAGAGNTPQVLPTLLDLLKSLPGLYTTIYNDTVHPSSVVNPVVSVVALDEYD